MLNTAAADSEGSLAEEARSDSLPAVGYLDGILPDTAPFCGDGQNWRSLGTHRTVLRFERNQQLDLDLVLIGGGLCKDFDMMIEHINRGVRNYGLRMMVNNVEIKPASLGNDAGVLGCAALFFRNN